MTLLLLFAIMITTFTNRPDILSQMQATAFGGYETTADSEPADRTEDVRYRPRSAMQSIAAVGRQLLTEHPAKESVAEGLEDLAELSDLVRSERCQIALRKEHLIDGGEITDRGRAMLRIISAQMQRFNGQAHFIAPNAADAAALIPVCLQIASETAANSSSFGVSSRATNDPEQQQFITIVVTRDIH